MSQIFHKILCNKPITGTTIRALLNSQKTTQTLIPNLVCDPQPNTKIGFLESLSDENLTHFNRVHVYPSFSFEYYLNPISSSGYPDSCPEKDPNPYGSASSNKNEMIWADSVKKKRKKKMNKHKLKKLKKRLRHCS